MMRQYNIYYSNIIKYENEYLEIDETINIVIELKTLESSDHLFEFIPKVQFF